MRAARLLTPSLLVAVALTACGGAPDGDAASLPQDTLIRPLERQPLTEADLAGLSLDQLALELPWTTNVIGRDPVDGAPPAEVRAAEVAGADGFDRVTFLLDDAATLPGYEISVVPPGAVLPCGVGSQEVTEAPSLVVALRPAGAGADGAGSMAPGSAPTGASRMVRAGLACDAEGGLVWVAELAQGREVRVLELRSPTRLAVDVR